MTASLPTNPSLRHLKVEAKHILQAHKVGDPSCCAILRNTTKLKGSPDDEILQASVGLQEVQFALAMEYGFKNWEEMKEHVLGRTNNTRYLHIHTGDSAADQLRQTSVLGDMLVWCDPVIRGPVSSEWSTAEWQENRARFLVDDKQHATEIAAIQRLAASDEHLERFREYREVVLWFDPCWFCQTILIRLLDWFARKDLGGTTLSVICPGSFPGIENYIGLGQLAPDQMAGLMDRREEITSGLLELGQRAWAAYCSTDPAEVEALLSTDTTALPYLKAALSDHLKRFPAITNGLNIVEDAILKTTVRLGRKRVARIVGEVMSSSPWSDVMVADHLQAMALGSHPLIDVVDASALTPPFAKVDISITQDGQAVLAGKLDNVRLNGIDRWLGGVHLQGNEAAWRWDDELKSLVAMA